VVIDHARLRYQVFGEFNRVFGEFNQRLVSNQVSVSLITCLVSSMRICLLNHAFGEFNQCVCRSLINVRV
jgi:hypothetical protein